MSFNFFVYHHPAMMPPKCNYNALFITVYKFPFVVDI